MKNDKFCFNRTLGYLVLLVFVVVGFFYVMGRANQGSKTTKSEASTITCTDPSVSGNPENPCFTKKNSYTTKSGACLKYTGCVEADGETCQTTKATSSALCWAENKKCIANQITEKFNDGSCRYMTGTKRTDGSCKVGYETNKGRCSPDVGKPLGAASMNLSSCGSKLPNSKTNPCYGNLESPSYKWDASGTYCLQNTACVKADGITCSTKGVSTAYCPVKMWYCDTGGKTAVCRQTSGAYMTTDACQSSLNDWGNSGFCFKSRASCQSSCPQRPFN